MSRMAARGRYYPSIGSYGRSTTFQTIIGIVSKTLSSLTVDSDATTLTWSSTVPTVSFIFNGGVQTHDLTQYISGFNSSLHGIRVYTGTLPTGVTLSTAGILTYNGTSPIASASVSYEIYPLASSDWVTRRTADGVTAWRDFSNPSTITPYLLDNGGDEVEAGRIAINPTGGVLGNGSLRIINSVGQTGTAAGYFAMPLNDSWTSSSQNFGSTPFYVFMRFKINAGRLVASSAQGWKWFIVGCYDQTGNNVHSTSNNASIVGQDFNFRGFPQGYAHNNTGYTNFEENRSGVGILLENSIDNGVLLPPSERYCLYPGPYTGCWNWPTDEWLSIKVRIQVTTYGGTSGNNFSMWVARQNATAWTQTHNFSNFLIGNVGAPWSGLNGLFPTGYQTGGITNQSVESHMEYDQIIVSTSDIALPAVGS